jgi:hypothetical protein
MGYDWFIVSMSGRLGRLIILIFNAYTLFHFLYSEQAVYTTI